MQEEAAAPAVTAGPERRAEAAHPLLRRLRRVDDDDGPVEDRLGGGQVLLQQQRRERQHVADVVEAVADVVVGEVGGGLEVDADEVADRVVVLGPVEPADRDAAVVARPVQSNWPSISSMARVACSASEGLGRGRPLALGGISPVRTISMTFSQTSRSFTIACSS